MDKNIPGGSGTPVSEHADNLEVSDFFELDDWIIDEDPMFVSPEYPQNEGDAANEVVNSSAISASGSGYREGDGSTDAAAAGGGGVSGKKKKEFTEKVAFKTKSEVEILDDGFKWRKYGKKMVKNSPNPRNYYKCSVEGCSVKKRVERDRDDPRYVVTTYEGVHNHQGPQ